MSSVCRLLKCVWPWNTEMEVCNLSVNRNIFMVIKPWLMILLALKCLHVFSFRAHYSGWTPSESTEGTRKICSGCEPVSVTNQYSIYQRKCGHNFCFLITSFTSIHHVWIINWSSCLIIKIFKYVLHRDDLVRAIKKLKVMGNGFGMIPVGGSYLVQSVPAELNMDHTVVLQLAEVRHRSRVHFSKRCPQCSCHV